MAQVLVGTEFEQYEEVFEQAIRSTWQAIAFDVMSSNDDFEDTLESIVDITMDANHVEIYGNLTGDAEVAWKKLYSMSNMHELRHALAKSALNGYA
jgi:hypothetical protein